MSNEITSIMQSLAPQQKPSGQSRGISPPTMIEKPTELKGDRVTLTGPARQLQLVESKPARQSILQSASPEAGMTYARTDNHVQSASSRLSTEGNAQRPSPAMANMMGAFFTTSDMKGFDVNSDLNADGVVNFHDLAALRDIETGADTVPPESPKTQFQNMTESFFSTKGSKGFNAASDLNGDGVINFHDLAALRDMETGVGTIPPETPKTQFENMTESFFSTEGSKGFNAASDLNGDGIINFHDLAALRDMETGVGTMPPVTPKTRFQNMTESFFSSEGSKGFNAASDLNEDGMINFHDLSILRSKMENS